MKYKDVNLHENKDAEKKTHYCCLHKRLVPLEIGFANKTHPNGFTEEPYYNFTVSMVSANVIRVKSYLCLDCKCEVKAPSITQTKKDCM